MADIQSPAVLSAEQEIRLRRVVYIIYFLAGSLAILTGILLYQIVSSGEGFDIRILLGIGGFIAFLVAARSVRRGKVVRGLGLTITLCFAICVLTIAGAAGHAPLLGGVMLFVFAGLIIYSFPEEQVVPGVLLLILGVLVFILLDFFWPIPRPRFITENPLRLILLLLLVGSVAIIILPSFASFSLRNKVFITFLIVALLPMGVLAIINSYVTRNTLVEDANAVLQVAAIQTASEVDNYIDNGLATIASEARLLDLTAAAALAQDKAVNEAARADILRHLHSYRDNDPLNIRSVALLSADGEVMLDTMASNVGNDESDRTFVARTLASNQPYVSGVEFPPDIDGPVLYFGAPIQDSMGITVGLIRAVYKADTLQDLVTQNTGLVGGESFGVLLDENQLHLANGRFPQTLYKTVGSLPDDEYRTLQSLSRLPVGSMSEISLNLPELQEKIAAAESEPFFSADDPITAGKINQIAVISLRTQPWLVGYFQPLDVFLEPVNALNRNLVLAGTLVAGLVTLIATLPTRFLVRPIEDLTSAASRIAGGDLTVRTDVKTQDEIGTLATTFNLMASRLEATLSGLEERVASRTRALETSARVSRSVSTILDQDELVAAVVRQVYEAFDYYHVQIYIHDVDQRRLLLVAGFGRDGESKAVRRHSLAVGEGLVGRAAYTNAPVLVGDTADSIDWVYNPQLPDTRSEAAVPISIGNEVLGVLDVQQDQPDGLQPEDVSVLQTFANQVAVALRNAGLYADIREQAEQESRINEITRRIQATTNIEQALRVAARELGHATGSDRVYIRMRPAESENGQPRPEPAGNGQEQEVSP